MVLTVGETAESWVVGSDDAFNLITKDVVLVNNADTPITAIIETNITGTDSGNNKVNFDNEAGAGFGNEFEKFWVGVDLSEVDLSPFSSGTTLQNLCETDSGTWNDTEKYCYWSAISDNIHSTFSGVDNGVFYVQIGDRETPQAIPAATTMNARMKLQFKINVAPAAYVFETQALTQSDSTDLDGLK